MRLFYKSISNAFLGVIFIVLCLQNCGKVVPGDYTEIDRLPNIDPDYTGIVIPPNIAPLNFKINEEGTEFYIDIHVNNKDSDRIRLNANKKIVMIPIKKWKEILSENRGEELNISIYIKDHNNRWNKFRTIENKIAKEEIDSHVAYRLINLGYVLWREMGIYQRNIENFDESAIFTNRPVGQNCMNCHSFSNNNPETMMFHMRDKYGGTMLLKNGQLNKVNTGTEYTMSAGVYPAWHPDGNHIAFSVNKVVQSFHAGKDKSIFVWDLASDLVVYDIQKNTVTTSPKVSTKRMENLPNWSPDGKYLYFCSGPERVSKKEYNLSKYDLMRIGYDVETNRWDDVETILSSRETGKSVSFPRTSPDGKYLLFCMSDCGYFSIHYPSSDLYMLELKTKKYRKLDINSEHSESFHSWSSNSRWFVFASKRRDGLCSRLYFSYVDTLGNAHKSFLMPQKNPEFYETYIMNYNVPELINGPVKVSHWNLIRAAHKAAVQAKFDSTVNIDALSGATKMVKQ
ncbi:PD40 domain-containing protein [candidate division WOR-3 bacterium]|nr:PD40 domain-containing protein [candidate division WOR-3 bacterium]